MQALALEHFRDRPAALWMTRGDDGAQARQTLCQSAVRLRDHLVFSLVRAGRHEQRTVGERQTEPFQGSVIDRRRRRVDFEVADRQGAGCAERT